jgi:hypothetical protein
MKFFPFLLALLGAYHMIHAQSFANDGGVVFLYRNESEVIPDGLRRGTYSGTHPLGFSVAEKLNLFEREYVYFRKSTGAYATEEKIIIKKTLYRSIRKLDKFFINSSTSGVLSKQEAEKQYLDLLDIAIKLSRYNTEKVEVELQKLKNEEETIHFLMQIRFND